MEKSGAKKIILFFCILFIILVVAFFLYYFITGKENPFSRLIEGEDEQEINDNYNGFYSYYDDLNGSKYIYSGCSISRIANYILVINDEYYLYRSSCMGTYEKGSGKTEDLDIRTDEEQNTYYIYYNDVIYDKDPSVRYVSLNNNISKITAVDLSTYQLFMKETQFEGNYYDLERLNIVNNSSDVRLSINRNEGTNSFDFSFEDNKGKMLYSKNINDYAYLMDMYSYGNSIAIVEKNVNEKYVNRYANSFLVLTKNGIVYKLNEMFPIIIDGVTLNMDNSIFIKFDSSKRYFRMLVGYDDKMCVDDYEESEKDDIMYYEFSIEYNYSISNFNEPKFQKIGRKSEGCRYVNSIIGDDV